MKKISILGCIAAALMMLAGCEQTGKDGYEGTNYIYLESEGGKTSLLGVNDNPITVNVILTKSLKEDQEIRLLFPLAQRLRLSQSVLLMLRKSRNFLLLL